jgi:hypothetical protein
VLVLVGLGFSMFVLGIAFGIWLERADQRLIRDLRRADPRRWR